VRGLSGAHEVAEVGPRGRERVALARGADAVDGAVRGGRVGRNARLRLVSVDEGVRAKALGVTADELRGTGLLERDAGGGSSSLNARVVRPEVVVALGVRAVAARVPELSKDLNGLTE
jgi:hypothetical protein